MRPDEVEAQPYDVEATLANLPHDHPSARAIRASRDTSHVQQPRPNDVPEDSPHPTQGDPDV